MSPHRTTHMVSYPRFVWRMFSLATDGSLAFYAWMALLTAFALVGAHAWAQQMAGGMAVSGMSDHVSWGLYIANFTFAVGLAAGGVMMVIPAYVYEDRDMHEVVVFGELVAVAAIVIALLFVVVDLGRPDRFWHMIPGLGAFHWPGSMLTWDVIVLNGYLLLNLHITGYVVYQRFLGREPNRRWYVPFVFVSIVWAISIHTVTAFLYSGLGGRPFWNSALLAPRFLNSAFVSGPAFLIVLLFALRRFGGLSMPERPVRTLVRILQVTTILNLFLLVSELFTEFYAGGSHIASARYLFFGLHGEAGLAPWIWTAIGANVLACVLLLLPNVAARPRLLVAAWKITVGIWAAGLMVLTLFVKTAVPVLRGDAQHVAE